MSLLTTTNFCVPSILALWWPNFCPKTAFWNFFIKLICSIHFIPYIYSLWASLLTPIYFRVPTLNVNPLVAKYLPKKEFPEFFENNICSIHFIPGIYPDVVCLWTPIQFRVPTPNFGHLASKYLLENGVSRLKILLSSFDSLIFILDGMRLLTFIDCKIGLFVGFFRIRRVVNRAGIYCPHL